MNEKRVVPIVHVRVAQGRQFTIDKSGEYIVSESDGKTRYVPRDKHCRILAHGIPIGIDFHWSRNAEFSLPGVVEVIKLPDGVSHLDNYLDAETYLTSVISSEMNATAPLEFLKAHAIISRSWLMGKIMGSHACDSSGKRHTDNEIVDWVDTADHEGFHVCADDHCQRYQGDSRVNENVFKAVSETHGVVIADSKGSVADARFSKCCGGITEIFSTCWQSQDYDYLTSVEDPYCNLSELSADEFRKVMETILVSYDRNTIDFHDWTVEVTPEDIEKRMFKIYGLETGRILSLEAGEKGASGRLKSLRILGEKGTFTVGKELAIRRLLSDTCLYSSWFNIKRRGKQFQLQGHGWGHGVGMCQIGAAVMALKGFKCEEILRFYYPNTQLINLYEK